MLSIDITNANTDSCTITLTNANTYLNTITNSNVNTITNTSTNNFKGKSGDLMRNPKAMRLTHFANPSSTRFMINLITRKVLN